MANPTPEQQQIIEAFETGQDLVIEAGAGTGKTTTLRLMAEATPKRRGIYIAYNRAIADDAKGSFPNNVQCATAHSFAFRAVGFQYKHRLNGPRVKAQETAQILGVRPFQVDDQHTIQPWQGGRMAMTAVRNFCHSSDPEITKYHVSKVPGLEEHHEAVRNFVLPYAKKAWADIASKQGRLKFEHDHYLKIWALTNPSLMAQFILFDEAQDANPVIAGVVAIQKSQKIMVGDRAQAIYGWRGAVDAMSGFDGARLVLSQSFRFGPAVATEANKWLTVLDAPLRLSGLDKIESTVEFLDTPDAVLCRTNAEAIAQALAFQEQGKKVALVGGAEEIKRFAESAIKLMDGESASHPDLVAFKDWAELVEYVNEDEGGSDLKVMVKLIDTYGPEKVIQVASATVKENRADIVISTAHKAKGREWSRVKIANDFMEPKNGEINKAEAMLAYVAVTRAKLVLDKGSLAWIDAR